MLKMLPLAAAALLVLAVPASAQTAGAPSAAEGEHLIAHYPAGWQPLPANRQINLTVVQLLPPGEDPQNYTESVVVQRHDGERQSPKDYVGSVVQTSRANCEGTVVSPINEAMVNGYKAAEVRFACTKSSRTGKSGLMMIKAIAGRDALHVVQRVWRGAAVGATQPVPVPDATIAAWDAFDATIVLCDTRDPKHPCPKTGAAP
jgi:hypothetical protein